VAWNLELELDLARPVGPPLVSWIEETPSCSIRMPTGSIPYALVHGIEPMLPIEVEIQLLEVVAKSELPKDQWYQVRYEESTFLMNKELQLHVSFKNIKKVLI